MVTTFKQELTFREKLVEKLVCNSPDKIILQSYR